MTDSFSFCLLLPFFRFDPINSWFLLSLRFTLLWLALSPTYFLRGDAIVSTNLPEAQWLGVYAHWKFVLQAWGRGNLIIVHPLDFMIPVHAARRVMLCVRRSPIDTTGGESQKISGGQSLQSFPLLIFMYVLQVVRWSLRCILSTFRLKTSPNFPTFLVWFRSSCEMLALHGPPLRIFSCPSIAIW